MKELNIMIKPASALCNLRCKYCFYANIADLREIRSFGIMSRETMEAMLKKIREGLDSGDHLTLAFQGGEPTMAGLTFFRDLVSEIEEKWPSSIKVDYALQTNAMELDEEWARFLAEKHFLVGISLDLLQEQQDMVRVDAQGKGTWKKVTEAIKLMERFHVEYNVLCTLTNQIARHPRKVWNNIEKLDLQYVQFTPCMDDLDQPGESIYALTPRRFASFYTEIFRYWLADFKAGKYRSIKLFDDLVNLLGMGIPTACGMNGRCQPQLIVEADGSTYPCDFYCLDEYCLGNITDTELAVLYQRSMESPSKKRDPLPELCGTCPYRQICGGNCRRMQREICCMPGDKECGYQAFLDSSIRDLAEIARRYRR